MTDEPIEQPAEPTERTVIVPRGRRFWLERAPRRPEAEDEQQEVQTDD